MSSFGASNQALDTLALFDLSVELNQSTEVQRGLLKRQYMGGTFPITPLLSESLSETCQRVVFCHFCRS